MITFEQAQAVVLRRVAVDYPAAVGLYVSASGLENDDSYQLFVDDSAKGCTVPRGGTHVVDKATGEYRKVYTHQYVIPAAQPRVHSAVSAANTPQDVLVET